MTAAGPQKQYFDSLAAGSFRIQRCEACSNHVFYPRVQCPRCASDRLHTIHLHVGKVGHGHQDDLLRLAGGQVDPALHNPPPFGRDDVRQLRDGAAARSFHRPDDEAVKRLKCPGWGACGHPQPRQPAATGRSRYGGCRSRRASRDVRQRGPSDGSSTVRKGFAGDGPAAG